MTTLAESLTKAAQTADLLKQDIREAHLAACEAEPFLEILLRDLLGDAMKIIYRLEELDLLAVGLATRREAP